MRRNDMPVGSHKDAFKAHQLVKKIAGKESNAVLVQMAANILMDFVKNQRQVNSDNTMLELPKDTTKYDTEKVTKALKAVDKLCGKCDESHDDNCFVNQTRRALIFAKTGVDLGSSFDGKKSLDKLIKEAEAIASDMAKQGGESSPESIDETSQSQNQTMSTDGCDQLQIEIDELKEKDIFRSTLIDEIVGTIQSVADGNFAAEMPVHDDEQLGKLATAFNLMLETVNNTMQNLDKLVAERSAEMRMIMNTVPVGLLSLTIKDDDDIRINPEYSKACEKILGLSDLRGRNFLDSLGLTKRRGDERGELLQFLKIFVQQLIPEEDMAGLNPFEEISIQTNEDAPNTWIRLKYHIIDKGSGETPNILVVIEDITRAKAMQAEIEKSEKENMQLKAIAEDPDLFCEFLRETQKILYDANLLAKDLSQASDFKPLVNEMFRGVHTIKGTAASFSLDAIAAESAELENSLDQLREANTIHQNVITETQTALDNLSLSVQEIVEKTEKLLGLSIGPDSDTMLKVPAKTIQSIISILDETPMLPKSKQKLMHQLEQLRKISVKKGLGQSLKIIPGLINRLGKDVLFVLNDNQIAIDCDTARELNTPFVHLIRNAFDHGIESNEERALAGKNEQGTVTLNVSEDDMALTLSIADDGKGLDAEKLKQSAIKKGLITPEQADTMTESECHALIFKPGFSTAESVSDVSGRGVGMDAVLTTIKDTLKGEIHVESKVGEGSTFIITIPTRMGSTGKEQKPKTFFTCWNGIFYRINLEPSGDLYGYSVSKDNVPNRLIQQLESKAKK